MTDVEYTPDLDAVLHDLRAQCAVRPRVEEADEYDEWGLLLYAPDGSGQGLIPSVEGTAAERLVHLADQAQDWAVEALWSEGVAAVWPGCPAHPGTHPLTARVAAGTAMWVCPKSGAALARIGMLPDGPGSFTAPAS